MTVHDEPPQWGNIGILLAVFGGATVLALLAGAVAGWASSFGDGGQSIATLVQGTSTLQATIDTVATQAYELTQSAYQTEAVQQATEVARQLTEAAYSPTPSPTATLTPTPTFTHTPTPDAVQTATAVAYETARKELNSSLWSTAKPTLFYGVAITTVMYLLIRAGLNGNKSHNVDENIPEDQGIEIDEHNCIDLSPSAYIVELQPGIYELHQKIRTGENVTYHEIDVSSSSGPIGRRWNELAPHFQEYIEN